MQDWHIKLNPPRQEDRPGTTITMTIKKNAKQTLKATFDRYALEGSDYGFAKTSVPVFLAEIGENTLVSRSQAKRVLAGVDRFKEVILDFKNVTTIEQPFADEIFRVFRQQHPEVNIVCINTSTQIDQIIQWVTNSK